MKKNIFYLCLSTCLILLSSCNHDVKKKENNQETGYSSSVNKDDCNAKGCNCKMDCNCSMKCPCKYH